MCAESAMVSSGREVARGGSKPSGGSVKKSRLPAVNIRITEFP
ncbi:Uncharacterised protein [Mycobacteroides abscessus subsp. abscessus]|nr:Uncharacterised protein [Mycobacteroides abscessus subsp. abscessus]